MLPSIDPLEFAKASASFKKHTAVGPDGFHVRSFALLCTEALRGWVTLWQCIELVGIFPQQVDKLVVALIPKAAGGGLRPIGIFAALYRIAMKCRKQQISEWESTIAQPFLAADAGRGPLSLIWKCAIKAEAAVASGQHFGGFLWDLARMFDQIGHCRAVVRARQLGLSESLILASMCAYRNARFIKLNEATDCGIDCRRGVAPGCALATTWAKSVVGQGLADIAERHG